MDGKFGNFLDGNIDLDLNVDMIINALPFGVLVANAKGEFKHMNTKIIEIWGGDPSKLTRHSIYDNYEGYYKNTGKKIAVGEWAVVKAVEKAESTFGEVIEIIRLDGKKATILNSAIPLFDDTGNVKGAILTISDITDENKIEWELDIHKRYLNNLVEEKTNEIQAQNRKLQEEISEHKRMLKQKDRIDKLKLVGDIAVGFAHEIRNPLTTVKGFLQVFQMREEFKGHLDSIELMLSELDYTDEIIKDFLTLADNKRNEINRYNLNDCIQKIKPVIMAQSAVDEKKLIIEMASVLPDTLIDEIEIRQLILNLAANALESMESNKSLTIKTEVENDQVVLSVKDEGPGISDSIIEELGRPFLSTKPGHQGMGLSVCYSIARRNNAEIDFETGDDGTVFFVKFPVDIIEKDLKAETTE
ncbi:two-component system sensor histidine kinase NtrB [Salipaludibacillus aurantiacus]|uniref:histidine kinase n=1 Tax=Salipaludibacillus aurantiacus TaxID=1601833 RepID=A0A1H9RUQ1_9BACI|nr:ATP-binding protein [Salipaludibacillus aurantiacus]SER75649.1 PAS fold [Salipaludibacillus aurantiacus]